MGELLLVIAVILVAMWIVGFFIMHILGPLVHLALIIAVAIILYRLIKGRRLI